MSARPRLGRLIDALGGLPTPPTTQRLVGHMADMAALEDAALIVEALLRAARDLVPLDSALLARPHRHGPPRRGGRAGPRAACCAPRRGSTGSGRTSC